MFFFLGSGGLTYAARGDIMIMEMRAFIKILSPLHYINIAHRRRCCQPNLEKKISRQT
jgi:hypothetical protein